MHIRTKDSTLWNASEIPVIFSNRLRFARFPLSARWRAPVLDYGASYSLIALLTCTAGLAVLLHAQTRDSSSPDATEVYRIGKDGVSQPRMLESGNLTSTDLARKFRVTGFVYVSGTLWQDGRVHDAEVVGPVGFGLDANALKATERYRFEPCEKGGIPVRCTIEIGLGVPKINSDGSRTWYSGPMLFAPRLNGQSPVLREGKMPGAPANQLDESVLLDFTVDPAGRVRDIQARHGSRQSTQLLCSFLNDWKFWPAAKAGQPVAAAGRILFFKGKGDPDVSPRFAPPPPLSAEITLSEHGGGPADTQNQASRDPVSPVSRSEDILTPLDPKEVDERSLSVRNDSGVTIRFINRGPVSVDIYWIDFLGNRRIYKTGLAPGEEWVEGTFLNHYWLAVTSGTGGSNLRNTGSRLAGFAATIPNQENSYLAVIRAYDGGSVADSQGTGTLGAAVLIHQYEFKGDAKDLIGSADGALMNNAHAADGELTLNGIDQFVQFGSSIVPASGSYSVVLSAKEAEPGRSFAELISQGVSGGPGFFIGHTPRPEMIRVSDTWMKTSVPFPSDGKWHCYGVVVDSSAQVSRLYVDGIEMAVLARAISTTSRGTPTRLGCQYQPNAEYFNGSLRDFRIYRGVLPSGRVLELSAAREGVDLGTHSPAKPASSSDGVDPFTAGLPYPVFQRGQQGVVPPQVVHLIDPKYSEEARKAKHSGEVILRVIIDPNGNVVRTGVLRSAGFGLDEEAIKAVSQWKFKPAEVDGKPVAFLTNVEVPFTILGK